MEQITAPINSIIQQTENILNRTMDNVYITTALKVFIGLYAAFAAPQLPPSLVNLMDNILVRIAFAFIIVLMATRDPSIALMTAVAFIITLQTANKYRIINSNLSVADENQTSWLPSSKEEHFGKEDEEGSPNTSMAYTNYTSSVDNYTSSVDQSDIETMKNSIPSENFDGHSTPEGSDLDNTFLSSAGTLESSQDNTVPGSNQNSCVTTQDNQHCTQGLHENIPSGN